MKEKPVTLSPSLPSAEDYAALITLLQKKDVQIEKLQAAQATLLQETKEAIAKLQAKNTQQHELIQSLTKEIKQNEARIQHLLYLLYGSKSEKGALGKKKVLS